EVGYTPEDFGEAMKMVASPDFEAMLRDTQASIDALRADGPVGIVGFCLGGTIAFAAAGQLLGLSAAVGYYGGMIAQFADQKPKVPTMLHFGEEDEYIPMSDIK